MNPEYLLKLAKDISLYDAKKYLRAKGWVVREIPKQTATIFGREEPEHPFDEIEFPKTEENPWYAQIMLGAAERLAKFEQRGILDVLQDLSNPCLDRIRFRVIAKDVELGSVELDLVKDLFQAIGAICLTSIKDLQEPSIYHRRVDNRTIQKMQKYARFGQTEHGSFTVNILVPFGIPKNSEESSLLEDAPETTFRDGIQKMIASIGRVQESIFEGNIDEFVQDNTVHPFISANMLAAFDQINQWEDTELEITTQWSPLVPCENARVYLKNQTLKQFNSLTGTFQGRGNEQKNRLQFSGSVMQLMGGGEDESGFQLGDVKIKVLSSEGDDFQTTVSLNSREWYDIAIKSHREKKLVIFSGEMKSLKSSYSISDVRDFRLSEEKSIDIFSEGEQRS